MSSSSAVLGKVSVTQRFPGKDTAIWTVSVDRSPEQKQTQSLLNFSGQTGGVTVERDKKFKNVFLFTVIKTTAEAESNTIKQVIDRWIRVVDRDEEQRLQTPLAEHSTTSVFSYHEQD